MCAARKSKKDQAVVEGNEELITSLNLLEKEGHKQGGSSYNT